MTTLPTTVKQAQTLLRERLYGLDATGEHGFEGLLTSALTEFTGQPFYLAKSGHQGGSDVRSVACNLFQIGLEAKRYKPSTKLGLDALLHKITDASRAQRPVDLWVLAATRSISTSDREELFSHGDHCGIGVMVLDWPNNLARLCDLAVVCASAVNACGTVFGSDAPLNAAMSLIREHSEYDQTRSRLLHQFTGADAGYANTRLASERWMEEAQASLKNAKSRLGGHHNLSESEYGVISRTEINTQMDDWYASNDSVVALLGDEGIGKSWAMLDWHNRLKTTETGAPLTIFLRATAIDTSKDIKTTIADAIRKQTGVRSTAFWKRRLSHWETCQGDGVPILVLIDGLNENYQFVEWAFWLQSLFEDQLGSMYRVVVSCWPDWWRESLVKMVNLAPKPHEIVAERFNDSELDSLLAAMNVKHTDFAQAVLELMRVPRLSSLVAKHREMLKVSGDVTAERVIYEDWKDRLERHGPRIDLTDDQMKVFVTKLGEKLKLDYDKSMTRGEVIHSLSDESGQTGAELKGAISELTSGIWLQPGNKPNTFKVVPDRIPFVLGATLMSRFHEETDVTIIESIIADFLDPLKAHSLGAAILRAATTIALIETDVSSACRQVLVHRWLEEQNFNIGDFDAFWRLIGLQPNLILDLAESQWLTRKGRTFTDEVVIKALANASEFPIFEAALKERLTTWLATAWPDPMEGAFLGQVDPTTADAKQRVAETRSCYNEWINAESAKSFIDIRLDESEKDWSWLCHRALAIVSYLEQASFVHVFEAWALSRAIMGRPRHDAEVGWLLRLNLKDESKTAKAMHNLIERLQVHDNKICQQAVEYLKTTMSHIKRASTQLIVQDDSVEHAPAAHDLESMTDNDLSDAARKYLLPFGWQRYEAESGARLINTLIEGDFNGSEGDQDLVLDNLRDLLVVLTTDSRNRLQKVIETKLNSIKSDSDGDQRVKAKLQVDMLTLRLYDAEPSNQSQLVLSHGIDADSDFWLPFYRAISLHDIAETDLKSVPSNYIAGWLDYLHERLPKQDISKLDFLQHLVIHHNEDVRKNALALAVYGNNVAALKAFSDSTYSVPSSGDDRPDRKYEYYRNRAFLELHSFSPPASVLKNLSPEVNALIAKHKHTDSKALYRFNTYLRNECYALRTASSWISPHYWCSHRKAVDALVKYDVEAVLKWLKPWLEELDSFSDKALMDIFPVITLMQALYTYTPKVSINIYKGLVKQSREGFVSSDSVKRFLFEFPASEIVDNLCSQQLKEATTDKELLEIVFWSHKYNRHDWLFNWIECLEKSQTPIDVAKAYTLLGCCDESARANSLWQSFLKRPPIDRWLDRVIKSSVTDYRRNQSARIAFKEFWCNDKPSVARHALKRVLETCDMRIMLWIHDLDPKGDDSHYDRQVVRSLTTSKLNKAIRKNWELRKKSFVQTPLAYSIMAPWK